MTSSALDRVTDALRAAGCTERSGNFSCPVHEDKEPSLHVTSDPRGVAMKCFANCDTKDIVTALGLEWDDLFEEPLREVARYPYHKDGRLFEKVRLAANGRKTFRWEPSLNGHRMPLYRVEEALALSDPVYLIESEKDVDALLGMNVSATCMPGGAGDWREEYSASLHGRNIIIVADRDEPGVKHARKVQAALKGKAASASIRQSRTTNDHDDVGDHMSAGFGLDQLTPLSLAGGRPYRTVSLAETSRRGVPAPVLLCDGLLYEGGLHSIAGAPDCGKGHPVSTSLLTPGGWRKLGSLVPGDRVIGADGKSTKIAAIYDRGILPVYRVTFSDGASVLCDGDHLWRVQTPKMKNKSGGHYVRSTRELASESLFNDSGRARWYIPICAPVQHPQAPLPVDPYLAGVMLGNAAFTSGGTISLHWDDREIINRICKRTGLSISEYRPHTSLRFHVKGSLDIIRTLGQEGMRSGEKFIPDVYMTASEGDRRELLAGLMDTDGSVMSDSSNSAGNAMFHSTSRKLAEGVRELTESLGGIARIFEDRRDEDRPCYNVTVLLRECPFTVSRKASRWKVPKRGISRAITSISLEGEEEVRCIKVTAEDSLYVTERHIVTHNTTLALYWAVHLLREGKPVVFLDEEGGEDIVVEKMHALGATHEELELVTYVPFPGRSWDDDDIGELMSFAKEIDPAMLLVDSSAAFLARAGLDENSAPAVTSWWSRVLTPVARDIGAAVLVIDHDTKGTEVSRYARGSGAKLAALDVQIKVTMVTPFTRQQEGILKVVITKDRRGWLHRNWNVDVRTGEGVIDPEFTRETPDDTPAEEISGAPGKRSIYAVLDDIPKTYHHINELVHEKDGFYLKRTTVSQYLNELLKDGLVEKLDGRGRENEWIRKMSKDPASGVAYSASDVDHSSADVEYPWEAPF